MRSTIVALGVAFLLGTSSCTKESPIRNFEVAAGATTATLTWEEGPLTRLLIATAGRIVWDGASTLDCESDECLTACTEAEITSPHVVGWRGAEFGPELKPATSYTVTARRRHTCDRADVEGEATFSFTTLNP